MQCISQTTIYLFICSCRPPDMLRNTVDPNQVCGEHGNVQIIEEFGTSTFEKDGTINLIWVNIGPNSDESSGIPSQETRMSTVDDNAVFTYVHQPGVFTYTITETFYGAEDAYLIGVGTGASNEPGAPNFQRQSGSLSGPKIIGKDNFLPALKKAYEEHKIADTPDWVKRGQAIPSCLSEQWGSCPTDEDWCLAMDPSCNESVYQEPAASLNGFGIALTTILVLGFVSFGGYILKRYLVASQQKRYKLHFAKVIVDRIGHIGHLSQLDPKEMEEEFKRIDGGLKGNDGMIQKDELWAWIQSGKAGTMTKQDFDALFTSMDVDGDGEVSFIEFCGFMARCGSEYDKESEALLANPRKAEQIRGITKMVSMKKVD
jgi:Ca2+-binding EF-hand superfamily protein